MLKNKQATRSLIAFLVTWAFLVLAVTGIILYIVPQGRIAYWTHWSLLGLAKEDWGNIHILFGGVFIVTGVWHLVFNWKPFVGYIAKRAKGHLTMKREIFISLLLTLLLVAMAIANLPPVSWVFDLNEQIKNTWATKENEPPFGHAEEASLARLAQRLGLKMADVEVELDKEGIRYRSVQDSLDRIARDNGLSPMQVYAAFRHLEKPLQLKPAARYIAESVEALFEGKGWGRKTLAEVCAELKIPKQQALSRLKAAGINMQPADKLRPAAADAGQTPMDILKILLIDP